MDLGRHGGHHHHHGGRGWRGRGGPTFLDNDDDDVLIIEDERDPHDALMLTDRDTTVVTQATNTLDNMPSPYGSQEEEESLFNGVSADDSDFDNRVDIKTAAAKSLASRTQGVATSAGGAPAGAPMAQAPISWKPVLTVAALAVGLSWLFARRA